MSGSLPPISPDRAFFTPHRQRTEGAPPPKKQRLGLAPRILFTQEREMHTRDLYPAVGPLMHEQLEGLEKYARGHLPDEALQKMRFYVKNVIFEKSKSENKQFVEIALLRYYIERDQDFQKPKISLLEQKIDELLETVIELEKHENPHLPSGIMHTFQIVFARIIILPSGTCNLRYGALAVETLIYDMRIASILGRESHEQIRTLCRGLLANLKLCREIEQASQVPAHPNLQPLVRTSLCIGETVAIYPHYNGWLILMALMGKIRQYSSPDCSQQSIHASASRTVPEKVAANYRFWFTTGNFTVNGFALPIDTEVMIPPLSLELATDHMEVDAPADHPVLALVARVTERHITAKRGSTSLAAHLRRSTFGQVEEERFERALAAQVESPLCHLHIAFLRIISNNRILQDPLNYLSNHRGHFLAEMQKSFPKDEPLAAEFQKRLQASLWLFDIKHKCYKEGEYLVIDPRHGKAWGIDCCAERQEAFTQWLTNSKAFFEMREGKWVIVGQYAQLEGIILAGLESAFETLYRETPSQKQRLLKIRFNQYREQLTASLHTFISVYIANNLKEKTLPASSVALMRPLFQQSGHCTGDVIDSSYGIETKYTFNTSSPIRLLAVLAKVLAYFPGKNIISCSLSGHATTIPRSQFFIPTDEPAAWIEENMIVRGKDLLKKEIPQEIVDFIASNTNFDFKGWYSAHAKATYQEVKELLLSKATDVEEMRIFITRAFHLIPTEVTLVGPLSEERKTLARRICGPCQTVFAHAKASWDIFFGEKKLIDLNKYAEFLSKISGTPSIVTLIDLNYADQRSDHAQHVYTVAACDLGGDPNNICLLKREGVNLTTRVDFERYEQLTLYKYKK